MMIARGAQDRLSRSLHVAPGGVASPHHQGVLILQGCVPSQYLKQVAQEAVSRIEGVRDVINRIEVRAAADRDPGDRGRGAFTTGG